MKYIYVYTEEYFQDMRFDVLACKYVRADNMKEAVSILHDIMKGEKSKTYIRNGISRFTEEEFDELVSSNDNEIQRLQQEQEKMYKIIYGQRVAT